MGTSATGTALDSWADQSGTVSNFTATTTARPTLVAASQNGRSVVRFNGSANVMNSVSLLSAIATASAFTIVAAWKNTSVRAAQAQGYEEPPILSSSSYLNSPFGNATQIGSEILPSGASTVRVTQTPGTFLYTETILSTTAGGTLSVQLGTAGTPSTLTAAGVIGALTNAIRLGANYSNGAKLTGDVGEVLVYARTLTGSELAQLRAYMISQWGVT